MKSILQVLLLLVAFTLTQTPLAYAESKTPMTTKALKTLITGTVVHGTSTSGKKFIQVFGADGSLKSGFANNRDSSDKWIPRETGSWKASKGRICNSYTKPKKRSGGCDKFYKTSAGQYVYKTSSGKWGSFDKIKKGNTP